MQCRLIKYIAAVDFIINIHSPEESCNLENIINKFSAFKKIP